MAYVPQNMRRGMCLKCRQQNELHQGNDGKWYCEDCLVRLKADPITNKPAEQPNIEVNPAINNVSMPFSKSIGSKRQEYLDYIVKEADPKWITDYLNRTFRETCKWVEVLQKEQNELVLMRMATQLGFGGEKPLNPFNTALTMESMKDSISTPKASPKRIGRPKKSKLKALLDAKYESKA